MSTQIALFKSKAIRKIIHENEWWFSVTDVVAALTGSADARDYWYRMKVRVENEDGFQLSTICRQLKLASSDGKKYETDCASTEGLFRIIQSIPSPKAEPFKRWLAKDYEIFNGRNFQGLTENQKAAKQGGTIAGDARAALEKKSRKKISTKRNYLKQPEDRHSLKQN